MHCQNTKSFLWWQLTYDLNNDGILSLLQHHNSSFSRQKIEDHIHRMQQRSEFNDWFGQNCWLGEHLDFRVKSVCYTNMPSIATSSVICNHHDNCFAGLAVEQCPARVRDGSLWVHQPSGGPREDEDDGGPHPHRSSPQQETHPEEGAVLEEERPC